MWDRFSGNGGSKTASRGLRAVDDLTAAVISTLSDHLAIVDGDGNIIAVNKAWKAYDCECGDHGLQRSAVGSNYVEACEAAEQAGVGGVEGAVLGMRAVLDGSKSHFSLTYLCHPRSERRWFRMTVTPIGSPPDAAIISHAAVGVPALAGEAPLDLAIASTETGEPHLRALTENLAKTIGARFAFLSEVVDQRFERLRLIALWSGEGFEESFEYDLRGTPCQDVLRGELCVYPANVQESFPDDAWLKEIAAQCYLGIPLFGSAGEVIGHLGVIHDQPLDNLSFAEHVLRAIAAQASPELERLRLLRALQKSERTARALLNAPMDSAILLEPDGTITELNEVAAMRLGTTAEEAVGSCVFDLLPPELAATRRAAMDKVLTSRKPLRMEDERAGMHFETSVYPVLDPDGDVEGVAIFAVDVTARKVAEEQLAKSEEKIRLMVDTITHGVEVIDPSGVITFANAAYHRIFEYEDGELIGKSVLELAPSEHDRAALRDYLAFVAKEEPAPVLMTAKKKTKSGRIIDVEVAWDYERDGNGQTTRLVAVITDVTVAKQAAAALAQSERRIRQVTEHISEIVWLNDPVEGRLLYVSPAYEEIWGRSCQSLYDDPQSWLKAVHPDDLEYVKSEFGKPQERWDQEYRIIRPDGSVRWVWDRGFPISDKGDGRPRMVGAIIDITDRKQAAEALRQSAERNASLLGAIPDMIFSVDRQGVYVGFKSGEGIEPYAPAEQFLGRTMAEILPTSLAEALVRQIRLVLDTGRQGRHEYSLERDDGRHDYEARIVKSNANECLVIVRDVTAQKRLEREEQLREARDKLEGAVEKMMFGKNPYGLTFREFTVLHLAADGEADKGIADQLGISTFTVSKHIANILAKMDAGSRTEACVRALREGLLT